jgi:hypothetical protein
MSGNSAASQAARNTTVGAARAAQPPGGTAQCPVGMIRMGIFFDGTGNNMKLDYDDPSPDQRKHSNVVKLFQGFPDRQTEGYFPYYIPGVGTSFPEIGDRSRPEQLFNFGSSCAEMGEDRIIWAFTRLLNSPYRFVFPGTQLIPDAQSRTIANVLSGSGSPAAQRRVALKHWQDKLKAALAGTKPEIEQINLSVFGFSRGAAEARVFVNWLFEVCQPCDGGWAFAGIPIRLQFLGIFDTVASVGASNLMDNGLLAGHQSWADNYLEIHPAVEQCVHYVAGHEVRACFPLDSVRVKSKYPANAVEVMYPGSHSDVGGGYAPKALGVSPTTDSFMSIIPGVSMYQEARKAGVPLLPFERLDPDLQSALTPSSTTIVDFNAYLADAKVGSGPVEELGRRHMALYFSYRFKHRNDFFNRSPYASASSEDKACLRYTQETFLRCISMGQGNPLDDAFDPARAVRSNADMLKAAGLTESLMERRAREVAMCIDVRAVTPAVTTFADRYVHDSVAGFLGMGMNEYFFNGMGLAKFRTVFMGND